MVFLSWTHLEFYSKYKSSTQFILIRSLHRDSLSVTLGIKAWEMSVIGSHLLLPHSSLPPRASALTCGPVVPTGPLRQDVPVCSHASTGLHTIRGNRGQMLAQTMTLAKIIFRVSKCSLLITSDCSFQLNEHLLNIYYVPGTLPDPGSQKDN